MESPEFLWRVDYLRKVPAIVRFVSAEPLLGSLQGINLDGIHWLIGGGESQAGARPAKLQWFRELRAACKAAGTKFFLKQLGGHPSKRGGDEAILDGRRWVELPPLVEQQPGAGAIPQQRLRKEVETSRVTRGKQWTVETPPSRILHR